MAVDPSYQTEDSIPALRHSHVSALVNVIYGCNERCTYCVVPNTRGVEQSRSKDAVLAEIASLVAAGVPEVTLLGQNIDSWGRSALTASPPSLPLPSPCFSSIPFLSLFEFVGTWFRSSGSQTCSRRPRRCPASRECASSPATPSESAAPSTLLITDLT